MLINGYLKVQLRCFVANLNIDGFTRFFVLIFGVKKCACAIFHAFCKSVQIFCDQIMRNYCFCLETRLSLIQFWKPVSVEFPCAGKFDKCNSFKIGEAFSNFASRSWRIIFLRFNFRTSCTFFNVFNKTKKWAFWCYTYISSLMYTWLFRCASISRLYPCE